MRRIEKRDRVLLASLVPRLSLGPPTAIIPRMTFDPPVGKAEGEPGRFCHMTSVMLRHPYIRYRRGRQKTFALTAVHPAYVCEATTAKEPPRSQVAELEPCYFTHTLAIDEVGPACSSMAPVLLLGLFSRCCFARVRRVNGGQRKGFLFPSRSLQYTSTEA